MNNRYYQLIAAVVISFVMLSASAQLKIAVISAEAAILGSDVASEKLDELQTQFKPRQDQVSELETEIRTLDERARRDQEIMSQAEIADIQAEISQKQQDYQYHSNRLATDVNQARNDLIEELLPQFEAVLNDLIEVEGYDLVLNYVPNMTLFVNQKHNITKKVIEKINERNEEGDSEDSESTEIEE